MLLNMMSLISIPKDHVIPIIGLGAAVTVAVSYIVWGGNSSRAKDLRKFRKVAGLENLGNTCYLNTILQSLAACPKFVKWLQRALRNGQFKGKREDLAYKLSKTLEVVNDFSSSHSGAMTYSPHDVLHALDNCNWRHNREQQDCQELFQFLVNELQADSEKLTSVLSLSEAPLLPTTKNGLLYQSRLRSSIDVDLPPVSERGFELPFRGLIAHHLACTACGHKNRVTYSQFDGLSLYIPVNAFGMTTLYNMLENFTQVELVQGVDCEECLKRMSEEVSSPSSVNENEESKGRCNSEPTSPGSCKRVHQKQMTIAKLPQCLCIHVQRVTWTNTGVPLRKEEHVMFPEKLDMTSYHHIAGVASSSSSSSSSSSKKRRRDLLKYWNAASESPSNGKLREENFIGRRLLAEAMPLSSLTGSLDSTSRRYHQLRPSTEGNDARYSDEEQSLSSSSNLNYQLMSAVVHLGNATSGHFLTYRRAPSLMEEPVSRKWLCISDEHVTTATLTDVLSQRAYMLYYQRM